MFIIAVTISEYISAVRWPPRSDSANSHDLQPNAMSCSTHPAALFVRQTSSLLARKIAGQVLDLLLLVWRQAVGIKNGLGRSKCSFVTEGAKR